MSLSLMASIWPLPVSPPEKLALLRLADGADDDGRAFPCLDRLALEAGGDARTIAGTLRRLASRDLVQPITDVRRGAGYRLNRDAIAELAAAPLDPKGGRAA